MHEQPRLYFSSTDIVIKGWKYWAGCFLPLALCMSVTVLAKLAAFLF